LTNIVQVLAYLTLEVFFHGHCTPYQRIRICRQTLDQCCQVGLVKERPDQFGDIAVVVQGNVRMLASRTP
jgi:hypothetical protein